MSEEKKTGPCPECRAVHFLDDPCPPECWNRDYHLKTHGTTSFTHQWGHQCCDHPDCADPHGDSDLKRLNDLCHHLRANDEVRKIAAGAGVKVTKPPKNHCTKCDKLHLKGQKGCKPCSQCDKIHHHGDGCFCDYCGNFHKLEDSCPNGGEHCVKRRLLKEREEEDAEPEMDYKQPRVKGGKNDHHSQCTQCGENHDRAEYECRPCPSCSRAHLRGPNHAEIQFCEECKKCHDPLQEGQTRIYCSNCRECHAGACPVGIDSSTLPDSLPSQPQADQRSEMAGTPSVEDQLKKLEKEFPTGSVASKNPYMKATKENPDPWNRPTTHFIPPSTKGLSSPDYTYNPSNPSHTPAVSNEIPYAPGAPYWEAVRAASKASPGLTRNVEKALAAARRRQLAADPRSVLAGRRENLIDLPSVYSFLPNPRPLSPISSDSSSESEEEVSEEEVPEQTATSPVHLDVPTPPETQQPDIRKRFVPLIPKSRKNRASVTASIASPSTPTWPQQPNDSTAPLNFGNSSVGTSSPAPEHQVFQGLTPVATSLLETQQPSHQIGANGRPLATDPPPAAKSRPLNAEAQGFTLGATSGDEASTSNNVAAFQQSGQEGPSNGGMEITQMQAMPGGNETVPQQLDLTITFPGPDRRQGMMVPSFETFRFSSASIAARLVPLHRGGLQNLTSFMLGRGDQGTGEYYEATALIRSIANAMTLENTFENRRYLSRLLHNSMDFLSSSDWILLGNLLSKMQNWLNGTSNYQYYTEEHPTAPRRGHPQLGALCPFAARVYRLGDPQPWNETRLAYDLEVPPPVASNDAGPSSSTSGTQGPLDDTMDLTPIQAETSRDVTGSGQTADQLDNDQTMDDVPYQQYQVNIADSNNDADETMPDAEIMIEQSQFEALEPLPNGTAEEAMQAILNSLPSQEQQQKDLESLMAIENPHWGGIAQMKAASNASDPVQTQTASVHNLAFELQTPEFDMVTGDHEQGDDKEMAEPEEPIAEFPDGNQSSDFALPDASDRDTPMIASTQSQKCVLCEADFDPDPADPSPACKTCQAIYDEIDNDAAPTSLDTNEQGINNQDTTSTLLEVDNDQDPVSAGSPQDVMTGVVQAESEAEEQTADVQAPVSSRAATRLVQRNCILCYAEGSYDESVVEPYCHECDDAMDSPDVPQAAVAEVPSSVEQRPDPVPRDAARETAASTTEGEIEPSETSAIAQPDHGNVSNHDQSSSASFPVEQEEDDSGNSEIAEDISYEASGDESSQDAALPQQEGDDSESSDSADPDRDEASDDDSSQDTSSTGQQQEEEENSEESANAESDSDNDQEHGPDPGASSPVEEDDDDEEEEEDATQDDEAEASAPLADPQPTVSNARTLLEDASAWFDETDPRLQESLKDEVLRVAFTKRLMSKRVRSNKREVDFTHPKPHSTGSRRNDNQQAIEESDAEWSDVKDEVSDDHSQGASSEADRSVTPSVNSDHEPALRNSREKAAASSTEEQSKTEVEDFKLWDDERDTPTAEQLEKVAARCKRKPRSIAQRHKEQETVPEQESGRTDVNSEHHQQVVDDSVAQSSSIQDPSAIEDVPETVIETSSNEDAQNITKNTNPMQQEPVDMIEQKPAKEHVIEAHEDSEADSSSVALQGPIDGVRHAVDDAEHSKMASTTSTGVDSAQQESPGTAEKDPAREEVLESLEGREIHSSPVALSVRANDVPQGEADIDHSSSYSPSSPNTRPTQQEPLETVEAEPEEEHVLEAHKSHPDSSSATLNEPTEDLSDSDMATNASTQPSQQESSHPTKEEQAEEQSVEPHDSGESDTRSVSDGVSMDNRHQDQVDDHSSSNMTTNAEALGAVEELTTPIDAAQPAESSKPGSTTSSDILSSVPNPMPTEALESPFSPVLTPWDNGEGRAPTEDEDDEDDETVPVPPRIIPDHQLFTDTVIRHYAEMREMLEAYDLQSNPFFGPLSDVPVTLEQRNRALSEFTRINSKREKLQKEYGKATDKELQGQLQAQYVVEDVRGEEIENTQRAITAVADYERMQWRKQKAESDASSRRAASGSKESTAQQGNTTEIVQQRAIEQPDFAFLSDADLAAALLEQQRYDEKSQNPTAATSDSTTNPPSERSSTDSVEQGLEKPAPLQPEQESNPQASLEETQSSPSETRVAASPDDPNPGDSDDEESNDDSGDDGHDHHKTDDEALGKFGQEAAAKKIVNDNAEDSEDQTSALLESRPNSPKAAVKHPGPDHEATNSAQAEQTQVGTIGKNSNEHGRTIAGAVQSSTVDEVHVSPIIPSDPGHLEKYQPKAKSISTEQHHVGFGNQGATDRKARSRKTSSYLPADGGFAGLLEDSESEGGSINDASQQRGMHGQANLPSTLPTQYPSTRTPHAAETTFQTRPELTIAVTGATTEQHPSQSQHTAGAGGPPDDDGSDDSDDGDDEDDGSDRGLDGGYKLPSNPEDEDQDQGPPDSDHDSGVAQEKNDSIDAMEHHDSPATHDGVIEEGIPSPSNLPEGESEADNAKDNEVGDADKESEGESNSGPDQTSLSPPNNNISLPPVPDNNHSPNTPTQTSQQNTMADASQDGATDGAATGPAATTGSAVTSSPTQNSAARAEERVPRGTGRGKHVWTMMGMIVAVMLIFGILLSIRPGNQDTAAGNQQTVNSIMDAIRSDRELANRDHRVWLKSELDALRKDFATKDVSVVAVTSSQDLPTGFDPKFRQVVKQTYQLDLQAHVLSLIPKTLDHAHGQVMGTFPGLNQLNIEKHWNIAVSMTEFVSAFHLPSLSKLGSVHRFTQTASNLQKDLKELTMPMFLDHHTTGLSHSNQAWTHRVQNHVCMTVPWSWKACRPSSPMRQRNVVLKAMQAWKVHLDQLDALAEEAQTGISDIQSSLKSIILAGEWNLRVGTEFDADPNWWKRYDSLSPASDSTANLGALASNYGALNISLGLVNNARMQLNHVQRYINRIVEELGADKYGNSLHDWDSVSASLVVRHFFIKEKRPKELPNIDPVHDLQRIATSYWTRTVLHSPEYYLKLAEKERLDAGPQAAQESSHAKARAMWAQLYQRNACQVQLDNDEPLDAKCEVFSNLSKSPLPTLVVAPE